MKKFLLIFSAIFIFFSEALTAGENDFHISLEPFFNTNYGYIGEHLYTKDTSVENNQTSYIEWDEKCVCTFGINLESSFKKFYFASSVSFGLPGFSGNTYDSDWLLNNSIKTNYSISTETLNSAIYTSMEAGYTFTVEPKFFLTPTIGFNFNYINFIAEEGGVGWYGNTVSWDDDNATYKSHLPSMSYLRKSLFTWLGINCTLTPNDFVSIRFSNSIAPFVCTSSVDHHFYKGVGSYFIDKPYGFICAFKASLSVDVKIYKSTFLCFKAYGLILNPIKGFTYTSSAAYEDGTIDNSSLAGASEQTASFSAGIKFNVR